MPSGLNKLKSRAMLFLFIRLTVAGLAKKLFAWGVDAVFSDYPDLLS